MPQSKIFLSHASEDKPLVRRIETALEAAGFEVWVDHTDLHAGESFPKRIGEALAWCDVLLLVWSQPASVSRWVEMEWNNALSLRKVIIPCMRDRTPLPPLLDSISYANFREFERGLEQLLHALQRIAPPESSHQIEPTPPLDSGIRDRRIDAATPSQAEVGQRLELLVQVRFPDSPLLGLEEWPSKKKPDHLEQTSESIALQFPIDHRTGKLTSARLEIQIVAPDFEIAGNARQRVLVPPEEYSKCLSFLITPKQTGLCRINVEVYDVEQIFLGAIPLETSIGGAPAAQALNVANLMLFVVVGKDRATPRSAELTDDDEALPPPSPAPSIPPPPSASEGTRAPASPSYPSRHESGYERPRSKASGGLGRVAFWITLLGSLVGLLAYFGITPKTCSPASSVFFGEVHDESGNGVEGAQIEVREQIDAPIIGKGTTGPRGTFNFPIKAKYAETIYITVSRGDSLGFADFRINAGNQIIQFKFPIQTIRNQKE